jgi:hypothetical protein
MSKYTSEEQQSILNHVEQQKQSGMSIRAYCEQYGIKEHVLHYWRTGKQNKKEKPNGKFISLSFANPCMMMEVLLASGTTIRFTNYAPVDYIKSLCCI